jgi:hypothetical protein
MIRYHKLKTRREKAEVAGINRVVEYTQIDMKQILSSSTMQKMSRSIHMI